MPNSLNQSLALFDSDGDYEIYERLAKLWDEESHTWTEVERREFQNIHPKAYLSEMPSNPTLHSLYRGCSTLPTMTFYRLIRTVYEGQDWSQRRWFGMLLDIHYQHPELMPFIDSKLQSFSRSQRGRSPSSRSLNRHFAPARESAEPTAAGTLREGSPEGYDSPQPFSNSTFKLFSSQQQQDENIASAPTVRISSSLPPHRAIANTGTSGQTRHVSEEPSSQQRKRKHSPSHSHDAEDILEKRLPQEGDDDNDSDGDLVDAVVSLRAHAYRTEGALEEVFTRLNQVSDETGALEDEMVKLGGRLNMLEEREAERSRKIRRSLFGNH